MAVIHNAGQQRWEITVDGHLSYLAYRVQDAALDFHRVELAPAVAGRGIGGRLVRAVLEDARIREYQVIPSCPIVAGFVKRHPQYLTLVPAAYRRTIMAPDE